MDTETRKIDEAPFFHYGCRTNCMAVVLLAALGIIAALHAVMYEPAFMLRFVAAILVGLALEALYMLLDGGVFRLRSGSSAVTCALLVMSVPTSTPIWALFCAMVVAVIVVRMPQREHTLHLNPMLVGRLFLMMAFSDGIINWRRGGIDPDAVTTATPLELFGSEGEMVNVLHLAVGYIKGNWEDMYELVPGAPGEAFAPVILLIAAVLLWRGILSWRPGTAFVAAFALGSLVTGEPPLFSVLSGAILFSAVFIVSDPKTSPTSKGGQYMYGAIAGIGNALVRHYTYYSEGIVFSVLFANLLSPSLDRLAFWFTGWRLRQRSLRRQTQ